jgi:hypothetical protein
MGWNNVIFQLLIVTSTSGTPTGFFFYNGAPALGNLVAEITAPGVTSDPFGNSVPSSGVLNVGTWNASGTLLQHFGINNVGDIFLANSSGLVVVHGHSADGSLWFYDTSGESLGHLVASIAPAAGTDSSGNAYVAGVASQALGITSRLHGGVVDLGNAAQMAGTGGAGPAGLVAGGPASLQVSSGVNGAADTQAAFRLESQASNAGANPLMVLQAAISLDERATPSVQTVPQLFGNTGGNVGAVSDSTNGDGLTYDVQRLVLRLAGSVSINSAVTPVTIFSKHLGVGFYDIEIWAVTLNATAADAAAFSFAFTGTATSVLADFTTQSTGTAVVGYAATASIGALGSGQGLANNQQVRVNLSITVSVAGTLTFQGLELVAGNAVTVFAGSKMRIRPVNAT